MIRVKGDGKLSLRKDLEVSDAIKGSNLPDQEAEEDEVDPAWRLWFLGRLLKVESQVWSLPWWVQRDWWLVSRGVKKKKRKPLSELLEYGSPSTDLYMLNGSVA